MNLGAQNLLNKKRNTYQLLINTIEANYCIKYFLVFY